jgi:hypothetical protein
VACVREFLQAVGADAAGAVQWGEPVPEERAGVYLVSVHRDPGSDLAPPSADISRGAVDALLTRRPELTIDGHRPGPDELEHRLAAMWVPGEPVLYIGLAGTNLAERIGQYYRMPLSARAPQSGGWGAAPAGGRPAG